MAALRLIGSRNFGPYFVGNAASASGTWFQNLAASLLVYRQTHSPFLLGVLNFCNFVPVLVLAPWAGSMADRFDRRRVLVVTQLGSTAADRAARRACLVGPRAVSVVIVCALGLGVGSAFSAPASAGADRRARHREASSQSAVALNSMTYNLARAVGPALAALSVSQLGIPASFAINAASYLLLVVGVLVVRTAARRARAVRRRGSARASRLVLEQPRLLAFLLVVAAVGFASDPMNTEAPAFAHVFGGPTRGRLPDRRLRRRRRRGRVPARGAGGGIPAADGVTLLLIGGGVIGFSLAPWLGLGYVFLSIAGFGYLASNTSATSRLQLDVAEDQRGRIMALWSVAFLGLRPVASLADGAIAGAFGVRTAGVVLATPVLLGAAGIYFLQRHHVSLTNRP